MTTREFAVLTACLVALLVYLGLRKGPPRAGLSAECRAGSPSPGRAGKSGVTRLIAAGLRASGAKVLAKTTGSKPMLILPDGSEREIARPGGASVREQVRLVTLAARLGADTLVAEMMSIGRGVPGRRIAAHPPARDPGGDQRPARPSRRHGPDEGRDRPDPGRGLSAARGRLRSRGGAPSRLRDGGGPDRIDAPAGRPAGDRPRNGRRSRPRRSANSSRTSGWPGRSWRPWASTRADGPAGHRRREARFRRPPRLARPVRRADRVRPSASAPSPPTNPSRLRRSWPGSGRESRSRAARSSACSACARTAATGRSNGPGRPPRAFSGISRPSSSPARRPGRP